jgi:protease-4
MTLDSDSIAARRRLRRSLSLWRIAAVLAAGLAVLALAFTVGGDGLKRRTDHIARVRVEGLITGDRPFLKMLEKLEKADRVKAVIIDIDSPAAPPRRVQAIYEAIRGSPPSRGRSWAPSPLPAASCRVASDYIVTRATPSPALMA